MSKTCLAAGLLLGAAAVGWVPGTAAGADRMVIAEYFTNTGCSFCGITGPAMNQMLNTYPNTFTVVEYHVGDTYQTGWGNSRAGFYSVGGTPDAWFDGTIEAEGSMGSISADFNRYNANYNTRRAVATDVTIALEAAMVGGQDCAVTATVCIEAGGTAKTMRIYIAQVLDPWPDSPNYSRNTFRQAASTQDITVQPGDCQVVTRTLTFSAQSWAVKEKIKLIAWAQVPASSAPANVYQAAFIAWPFMIDCNGNGIPDDEDVANCGGQPWCSDCNGNGVMDVCDILEYYSTDCNTNGVPDECDLANGTSQDCNGNSWPDECDISGGAEDDDNDNLIPDVCEWHPGDTNCDGLVGFGDINPFVTLITNWMTYLEKYPNCIRLNGDINGDGIANFQDINPFVACIVNGGCP